MSFHHILCNIFLDDIKINDFTPYFSIRDYPVSLNKICDYKLLKKHETENGAALILKETPGDQTDAVDNNLSDWNKKMQTEECHKYTGGKYCTVKL